MQKRAFSFSCLSVVNRLSLEEDVCHSLSNFVIFKRVKKDFSTFIKMSIQDFTEGVSTWISETIIMPIKSFFKILACVSYIPKFTFVASNKMNHTGEVVLNISS